MASIRYFVFSILLWAICFNIAVAETSIAKTQDVPSSSAALPPLSTATLPSSTSLSSSGASGSISNAMATTTTASTTHSLSLSSTSTAVPTDSGAVRTSDSLGNNVDTDEILPIDPRVTPAFGLGGALLILTGLVYALVGIQSDYVYIFLSVAYLVSLSITVLILYVMNLPVSDAIQGAYLVGIVLPGWILAGGACVFKDLTNSVGCIFGGFSLAMWFLVLKPGGLLTTTTSVSIFIVGFCLVTFATSFHRLTRPYGLIGSFAFGGATAVTLGIDCFTRAGLKEFWAYIWNLNPNLFPYGTTTYPLTRGMKVEIAVIILITIVGVVAQLRLWKYMKKRREKKNAERLEEGRLAERRDEMIGRRVEFTNTRALNQWQAIYGENNDTNDNHSADSGIADMDNLKKLPRINVQSTHTHGSGSGSDIEMSDLPSPRSQDRAKGPDRNFGLTVGARKNSESQPASPVEADSRRTSHMSLDPASRGISTNESLRAVDANGGIQSNSKRNSRRSSKRLSIPLETSNQKSPEGDDAHSPLSLTFDENRKSKRFSRGSGLLRQLSQKSQKRLSKRSTKSKENLVEGGQDWDDRRSSVAATVDYLSETDDSDDSDSLPGRSSRDSIVKDSKSGIGAGKPSSIPASPVDESLRHSFLLVEAAGKELESLRSTPDTTGSKGNASATSNGQLHVAPLTKDSLPPDAPRIITTYRTSEWMKHLSHADTPVVEDPTVAEDDTKENQDAEASAPVDIEQLQQTSLTGLVAPAPPRRVSQASVSRTQHLSKALTSLQGQSIPENIGQIPPATTNRVLSRSSSQQSLTPQQARLLQSVSRKSSNQSLTPQQTELLQSISRSPSTQSLQNNPTLQTLRSYRASSNPIGPTLVESPTEDTFPTASRLSTSQYPSTTSLQKRSSSQPYPGLPTAQEPPSSDPIARSNLRQSSLPYTPTTGTRLPTHPAPAVPAPNRTSQLAAFRSSVQLVQHAQNAGQPQSQSVIPNPYALGSNTPARLAAGVARPSADDISVMEERRKALWDEKVKAETRRRMEEQGRAKRASVLDQRVGRGGRAEEAHRRVMRALMKEGGGEAGAGGASPSPSAGVSASKRTSMS